VGVGDTLFAYVLLSACDPPDTVVLQWNDGTWEHHGYWGANIYPYGTNGTDSLRRMGDLPPGGQWVSLEIPASQIGLEGRTLNGLSFDLMGGKGWFDRAGVQRPGFGALGQAPPSMVIGNPSMVATPESANAPQSRMARTWAWITRWILRRAASPPVSLAFSVSATVRTLDSGTKNRYSLYTPELSLMAETAMTTATNPEVAYEYVWFGGTPLAQIETATYAISRKLVRRPEHADLLPHVAVIRENNRFGRRRSRFRLRRRRRFRLRRRRRCNAANAVTGCALGSRPVFVVCRELFHRHPRSYGQ
jgi:hypothetical protein